MRCLTPIEAEALVKPAGFHISVKPEWRRVALVLDTNIASRQSRVAGRPTPDVTRLARFAEALNRWLPSNRHRLLWIDQWSSDVPSVYETFMAARAGLGETRSLSEAPGHYFDSYVWSERDQTAISADQARETGLLVGLMSLLMVDSWDGWLVADGSERIEFWEGNLFLYSGDKARLADADSLLNEFDCNRALE